MDEIVKYEEQLRQAMLGSDVDALDRLLADDLLFVNHFGQIIGKADDLGAHRLKLFSLDRLHFRSQEVRMYGDVAVTVTVAELAGVWSEPFSETITYTRVWRNDGARGWRVAVGQATRTVS